MLKVIAKFLKILNSETEPFQVSLAICFSMIVGLTPIWSIHNLFILFLLLILKVNISTFILGTLLFSGVAYLLDPIFHKIGLTVLTAPFLKGLWTSFYNSSFWRLEHFNNSILMGSLLFSLILFTPLYVLANFLIKKYRGTMLAWVRKTRLMQILKANKFFNIYQSISE
jgi:uncharacterized protein (TIGR03546 family)